MTNRRDLNQELFGSAVSSPSVTPPVPTREVSLSELADLSELTEEQAKVRVKITNLATSVEALSDGVDQTIKCQGGSACCDSRVGELTDT